MECFDRTIWILALLALLLDAVDRELGFENSAALHCALDADLWERFLILKFDSKTELRSSKSTKRACQIRRSVGILID
jgi:hypothetical protein